MSEKRQKVGRLLKQCGVGNRLACAAARVYVINAGSVVTFRSIDSEDDEHPNKLPFKGILLLTDQASTKPPHGSQGHRIFVPTAVAKRKLRGLLGMAVNYDAVDLDGHASRHKVGVITKAWIDGSKVWVEGFIYKKDFPEAARDLKDRKDLGMSMELADVYVRDEKESVWYLQDFAFTGASILKKNAAAYYQTALAAQAAAGRKENTMAEEKKKKAVAAAAGVGGATLEALTKSIASAVTTAVRADLGRMEKTIEAQGDKLEIVQDQVTELNGLYVIDAAGQKNDDEDEDDDDTIEAKADDDDDDDMEAKSDDDDDDDDMEAHGHKDGEDDEDEEDDVDASLEDLEEEDVEEEPGQINKRRGDKNKGNKNSVTDPPKQGAKVPGNIAEKRLKSAGMAKPFPGVKGASLQAAAVKIERLVAAAEKSRKIARRALKAAAESAIELKKTKKLVSKMNAQLEKSADRENRRSASLPNPVRNLLAKGGVNVAALEASGQKLAPEAMDEVFAEAEKAGLVLQPVDRVHFKNILVQRGLMDEGQMNRMMQ